MRLNYLAVVNTMPQMLSIALNLNLEHSFKSVCVY